MIKQVETKLKYIAEGSEFRQKFDILQVPGEPTFFIAMLGTNKAIGRVIIPRGKVNGETDVKLQWFDDIMKKAKPKKPSKKKK